jgi:hypothetical protein
MSARIVSPNERRARAVDVDVDVDPFISSTQGTTGWAAVET